MSDAKRRVLSASLAILAVFGPAVSLGQTGRGAAEQSGGSGWDTVISSSLILPVVDGNVAVRGVVAEVNADPADIFAGPGLGGRLYFEAHTSMWAVSIEGSYLAVDGDLTLPLAEYDADLAALEVTGYRRWGAWLEALIGGRLIFLGSSIGDASPQEVETDDQVAWFDPFIGARLQVPNSERWRLSLRGDIGGFGVGSEFAWRAYPTFAYRVSGSIDIAVAYRVASVKYESGVGAEFFEYDGVTFGPELGLVYRF